MFTANPTTRATYGFARGWETFTARAPTEEGTATAVFDDLERWLEGHSADRFLALVHARGGHPPWDVTGGEKDLAPEGYTGSLDAKHAGEMLAKVRRSGTPKLFIDADRSARSRGQAVQPLAGGRVRERLARDPSPGRRDLARPRVRRALVGARPEAGGRSDAPGGRRAHVGRAPCVGSPSTR
jgi:hypothetical protein